MKYSSSVNNYRETPYIISDTFANKVNYTATIKGAIYFAIDGASLNEPSIFQANGTIWVPVGGYGIGTDATLQDVTTNGKTTNQGITVTAGGVSTNTLTVTSLTPKSIPFVGTADLITEDNTNLVWDNVNKWIGIQTNVPTAEVDIHTTTATPAIVINNTSGLASRIGFQNTNVSKWTIGNSATNTFNFYNSVLASIAAFLDGGDNSATFNGTINGKINFFLDGSIGLKIGSGSVSAPGFTTLHSQSGTGTEGIGIGFSTGTSISLGFPIAGGYTYTYPTATGTLALTSNLSSYVPYTGATTNVNLGANTLTVGGNLTLGGTTTDEIITFNANNVRTGYIEAFNNGIAPIFNVFADQSTTPLAFGSNGSERMRLSTSGNVLINSTTDDTVNKLQVTGTSKFTASVLFSGTGLINYANTASLLSKYSFYSNTGGDNQWGVEDNAGGNIFPGTTAYSAVFGTSQNRYVHISSNNVIRLTISNTGTVTLTNLAGTGSRAVLADANGILSAPVSDQSVKENVQPLQYGLDTLMQLKPVQFEYIDTHKNFGEGLQIGNIAQDVEKIIPEAVFITPSTGLKGIDYNQFNGIYIKAIQEQQKIIEGLIERIEQLENKY